MLRHRFVLTLDSRYRKLSRAIWQLVGVEDCFGLRDVTTNLLSREIPGSRGKVAVTLTITPSLNFDPNQARDERGRWTATGSSIDVPGREGTETLHSEAVRLLEKYPSLKILPKVSVEVFEGDVYQAQTFEGIVDIQAGYSDHSKTKNGGEPTITFPSALNVPETLPLQLGKQFVTRDKASLFRHELGHHVHAYHERPQAADSNRRLSWQNLATEFVGADKPSLVSDYAKTHHKELFAESFAAYTATDYRRGSLPKPIEDYLDRFLTPPSLQEKITRNAGRWSFLSDSQKLEEFRQWLIRQIAALILNETQFEGDKFWERYTEAAFRVGMGNSFDDVRSARSIGQAGKVSDFYRGTRAEFLASSFLRPQSIEKVKILAARTFLDLKNVNSQMATIINRVLVDGFARGDNPHVVARRLMEQVGMSGRRAATVARTEMIRAHAEGQLIAYRQLGVTRLGLKVEFRTSNDDRVCPLCADQEGDTYTLEEAAGVIPFHPECRCRWEAAGVGEDEVDEFRRKHGIERKHRSKKR